MPKSQRYFVGRRYGQHQDEFQRLVRELEATSGVTIVAAGRSTVEVRIDDAVFSKVQRRFGAVCHIEDPIDFQPA